MSNERDIPKTPNIGICIECKTKLNDSTQKSVSNCPLCGRPMCEQHFRARLAQVPDFKTTGKKHRATVEILEKNHGHGDGHPCLPYTTNFWQQYEKQFEYRIPEQKTHPVHPDEPSVDELIKEIEKDKTEWKQATSQMTENPSFINEEPPEIEYGYPPPEQPPKNPSIFTKIKRKIQINRKQKKTLSTLLFISILITSSIYILNLFGNPDFSHYHLNKASSSLSLAFGSGWIIVYYVIPIPIPLSSHSMWMAATYFGVLIWLGVWGLSFGKKGLMIAILILLVAYLVVGEPERLSTQDFSTRQQLSTFLHSDNTDQLQYTSDFKCIDFSLTLIDHAKTSGYRMYFTSSSDHAFCKAYITSEDAWINIEPQTDEIW